MAKAANTVTTTVKQLEQQILETDGVVVIIRAPVRTKFISKKGYPDGRALNKTHTVRKLHERIRAIVGPDIEFEVLNGQAEYVRRTNGLMGNLRATYEA